MNVHPDTSHLVHRFLDWAYEQREFHLAAARPLSEEEKGKLAGYFDTGTLESTRVATVDRIHNPGFYHELATSGISIPLDFTQAVGLTLIDCVLIRREICLNPYSWIATLFHEMVHVVQLQVLGTPKMAELYINCLVRDKLQYRDVPFENQAYALTGRFTRGETPFPVRELIERDLQKAK